MIRVPAAAIHLGGVAIPAHFVFESAAYSLGLFLYSRERRRRGDPISQPDRNSIIVAAILGAAVGSKILAWLEDPAAILNGSAPLLPGGKTIVGGLLGGTLAVEWAKVRLGIAQRTGDLFAIPLAVAMAVGRIGCFLGGIEDRTYGIPWSAPWAVDFGDGIPRYPLALFEIVFLMLLSGALLLLRRCGVQDGGLYRAFLICYLVWRFASGFLSPDPAFGGLDSIQWACGAALAWYGVEAALSRARIRRAVTYG